MSKLALSVDAAVISRAKRFAKQHGGSRSLRPRLLRLNSRILSRGFPAALFDSFTLSSAGYPGSSRNFRVSPPDQRVSALMDMDFAMQGSLVRRRCLLRFFSSAHAFTAPARSFLFHILRKMLQ